MGQDARQSANSKSRVGCTQPVVRSHTVCRLHNTAVALAVVLGVMVCGLVPSSAEAAGNVLVVPTSYPTIQAAVDAARPGDEIRVRPGTYIEQVSIGKNLKVVGSGIGSTTIRAPQTLRVGQDGTAAIVDIGGGASVAISRLTVSGPGSGTCEAGPLGSGIHVLGGGHLDLRFARVTHIHNSPIARCPRSGAGILVGDLSPGTGSAAISYSEISDYQAKGILILSAGAEATIDHNLVTGPDQVSADGIDVQFAAATVSQNLVSGNECRAPGTECGTDFFEDFQHAGILAGGPGTVITHNVLRHNQLGIYAFDSASIASNLFVDNSYFGMALQDGSFTATRDVIEGGTGGVAVVAASADTVATLNGLKIEGTTGARVQQFECCGFTATLGR